VKLVYATAQVTAYLNGSEQDMKRKVFARNVVSKANTLSNSMCFTLMAT
jgi:hypothetical protein